MSLDRNSFLFFTAALAGGAAAGWVVRDQDVLGTNVERVPPLEQGLTAVGDVPAAPATLACDDSVATVPECPPIAPTSEGGCLNIAARRCPDFRATLKPRVAAQAVACLRGLQGAEVCDAARVSLCAHAALMLACQEPAPIPDAELADRNAADARTAPQAISPAVTTCTAILAGCSGATLAPNMADCLRTVSGMTDAGRASLATCMATHCGDKGLLGCESAVEPRRAGSTG